MSGANQVDKFAHTNRENQLAPLSAIGPEFHQRVATTITASPLTAQQFASDLLFTAATPGAIAGPTAVQLCQFFQTLTVPLSGYKGLNPSAVNSRYDIIIQNTDAANKTLTLDASMGGTVLTILAATTYKASFELTAVGGPGGVPPQAWRLFDLATTGVPIPGGPGLTSYQQSAAALAAGVGTAGPRLGPAIVALPGDLVASDVGFVPTATLAAVNTQTAINELDTEKVTLRDQTGARNLTGATGAGDLLVAINTGDNYVPSTGNGNRISRVGSIQLGIAGGGPAAAATGTGFSLDACSSGATPINGLINAVLSNNGPATAGYAALRVDTQLALNFGQVGNTQSAIRVIMPVVAGAIGGNGGYAIECDIAGVKNFFVNSLGQVRLQQTVLAGGLGAVLMDANNMLTLTVSSRKYKDDIKDVGDTSFILKVPARQFVFKSDAERHVQVGAIVEEVIDAGASSSYIYHEAKGEDGEKVPDFSAPRDLNDRALFWALVNEVQKLKADVEQLKRRKTAAKKD